jgi:hypothetical protein
VKRLLLLALLGVAGPAMAQMPDLHAMLGRPLPTPEIAAGTVSVRVSKQLPMNVAPDVEVTAIVTNSGGDSRKRVVKTGPDGRANFEGVAPGSTFEATATVDGEAMKSQKFTVPSSGGTRILLIAGLGAGGGEAPAEPQFALGATTGRVEAKAGLPAGTLEVVLLDEAGKPIAGRLVQLGQVGADNSVKVTRATSDASGLVRFSGLATGESTGYAAVIEHQGMRLGTEAFRMEADKGMRGEIHALGRTADPSVLRFDNRSKIIFEVGEDSLQVMEQLVFKNTSDKMFDPGGDGLLVPLPEGFEGAREIEGTLPLDVRAGQGVAIKSPIAPNNGAMFATQIRVGFVIPAGGSQSVEFKQALPFGLEGALLLIPSNSNLTPDAPGLKARAEQPDTKGNPVKIYELDSLSPGATLKLMVHGLPALERTGRKVAAVLCLLLIAAAVVGSRKPRHVTHAEASADKLTERREKLFAELVALEQARRQTRPEGKREPGDDRRQELIAKLENVYRELATVSHGGPAGL